MKWITLCLAFRHVQSKCAISTNLKLHALRIGRLIGQGLHFPSMPSVRVFLEGGNTENVEKERAELNSTQSNVLFGVLGFRI